MKQLKDRTTRERKTMIFKPTPNSLLRAEAVKAAFPFFGGEDEKETETETGEQATASSSDSSSGATAPKTAEAEKVDPAKVAADPEALGKLIAKYEETNAKLVENAAKLAGYEAEAEKQERAKLSKEEGYQRDLADAHATIQQMDEVIKNVAVVNAIQGNPNLQFHSAAQVMRELADGDFEVEVDLESRTAKISGIDNALANVAKDSPWLVKNAAAEEEKTKKPVARATGAPPRPPATQNNSGSRRDELMNRFPVIRRGNQQVPTGQTR